MLQRLYDDFDGDCHDFVDYFRRHYAGDKLGALQWCCAVALHRRLAANLSPS